MESLSVATLYADVFDDEEIGFATGALTPITTVSGEDPLLCDFPELNPFEIDEYIDVDGVPRYDPYEDKVVGLSEVRRRSELKRLNNNGWEREEVEDKACNKRRRYFYHGPSGVTVTSLKHAMKEISLGVVVDKADNDSLEEAEKCMVVM